MLRRTLFVVTLAAVAFLAPAMSHAAQPAGMKLKPTPYARGMLREGPADPSRLRINPNAPLDMAFCVLFDTRPARNGRPDGYTFWLSRLKGAVGSDKAADDAVEEASTYFLGMSEWAVDAPNGLAWLSIEAQISRQCAAFAARAN